MGIRVLVADDSRTQQYLACTTLRSAGFEPVGVTSGLVAAAALCASDGPQLAILDWQMPGMSGVDVCSLVRRFRDGPVHLIVLTADTDPGQALKALQAGADQFATKPCTPAELVGKARAGLAALGAAAAAGPAYAS